ncbi:unnamed protein product [Phaeothamnion confervicola]
MPSRGFVASSIISTTLAYVGTVVALPPAVATTLRTFVLGFVARGRRSAGGGGHATGGFGVPTRADLLSPLHLGGLGVRDPALWAMAGQQPMLLHFAAAWKADGPLATWAWATTQALEAAAAPWGNRCTLLHQPQLLPVLRRRLSDTRWRHLLQALKGWYELPFEPFRDTKAKMLLMPLFYNRDEMTLSLKDQSGAVAKAMATHRRYVHAGRRGGAAERSPALDGSPDAEARRGAPGVSVWSGNPEAAA